MSDSPKPGGIIDSEKYRAFLDDANSADAEMLASGMGYAAADVHAYILARARGEKAKRPKPVKWRK